MEQTTPVEQAQTLADRIKFAVTLSDGWRVADEDYPIIEEVPDDFPDEYLHQYEVTGFTNGDSYVGIWWLRSGERLQAFYDSSVFGDWGDVYDVDGVVTEIEERL